MAKHNRYQVWLLKERLRMLLWEPTPDAELAKQGVDLEALRRARESEK